MASIYGKLSKERKEEQGKLEATATGNTAPVQERQSKSEQEKMSTICVSISNSDKNRLQAYARRHGATVSGLIRTWIEQNIGEEGK